ncbi:MAG: hypothetical protein JWQ40_2306 [Segetibacter sp.]|jgi:Spy/CpxP family protein refolding chaperone|nr:hypothetical protein [Segetibacter sp.]
MKTNIMKKYILSLSIIVFFASSTFAQSNSGTGGVRRGGTSLEMRERMKERLKEELKINNDQTDSIAAIQNTYQFKIRALKNDTNLSDDVRRTRIAELEAERKLRLKAVLTDEQIIQLDAFMQNRRKRGDNQGTQRTK